MLRASVETEGAEADYRGIVDAASAEESSVPGAGALIGLVEASYSSNGEDGVAARERVRNELGSEALVDAAAVIGNFERMVRIADGTGIPLDAPVNVATEAVRVELGIDAYGSADSTKSVRGWQRLIGRILEPVVGVVLRRVGRRARAQGSFDRRLSADAGSARNVPDPVVSYTHVTMEPVLFEQPQWSKWSVLNLLAGGIWISQAATLGAVASIPFWVLGAAFMASGVAQLLWPGDDRIAHTGALAGFLGPLVALPYLAVLDFGTFLLLAATALAAAWGAARIAFQLEPHYQDVPVPQPTVPVIAKVAVDEAILGFEQFVSTGFALDGTLERVIDEIERTHALFENEGFFEKPANYHQTPPDLEDPEIRGEQIGSQSVQMLRFESGYEPAVGEPGRERWLGYEPCRDGRAYVLRHEGAPRPWMICTNGYRMGHARIDVGLFKRFHQKLGLNVVIPVLPLHGPRRIGWQSGSGFLGIDLVDTLHAAAQSVWDMRRLYSWVRAQDAPAVGAFGLSLGGYTTAVFASLTEGLSCVIPGIPLADITRMLSRHASPHQMRYAESRGFDLERASQMLRVVAPLVLQPKVPLEGRMIFGATADRLVSPDHVRDLWRHWDEPEIVWYDGAHVTFASERRVWSGVDRTLRDNGVSF